MQRIDSENVSETLPAPQAEGATVGYFKDPDGLGTNGTKITADWLNSIQEEIAAVITEGGITLDKSANTQLRDAIVEIVKANSTDDAEVVDLIAANSIHGTVGTTDSRVPTSSGVDGQTLKATQVELSTDGQVGNVSQLAVGTTLAAKEPAAALEVNSTTKGVLLPRMTTTQRSAISAPPAGLLVHDTTQNRIIQRGADGWRKVLAEEPSGAFGFPTLTQTERDSIASPFNGMMIFNSSKRDMQVYRAGVWENIGTPAGSIAPFAGASSPDGWLICDGSLVSRSSYADLFRSIGVTHGVGNGSTTFSLPDYRGRFLRGASLGASTDPDRTSRTAPVSGTFQLTGSVTLFSSTVTVSTTANIAPGMTVTRVSGTGVIPSGSVVLAVLTSTTFQIGNTSRVAVNATTAGSITLEFSNAAAGDFVGSSQSDAMQGHFHTFNAYGNNDYARSGGFQGLDSQSPNIVTNNKPMIGSPIADSSNGSPRTSSETRPINSNVNYIIKF